MTTSISLCESGRPLVVSKLMCVYEGMLAKPRSRLLQLAHGKTFHPSKDVFEECVVEFWVSLLTATAALCLTVGVIVGLSGWAFAISHRLGYSGLRWVSAAGGLVAVGAALDLR